MDRQISQEERKKALHKRIWVYSLSGILLAGFIILLSGWFGPSLTLASVQIGNVDRGPVEVTVSASGKLTPLIEEIVVSPIHSRILEVYKNPGDSVRKGEALLRLELSTLESEYHQMLDKREILKSELLQVDINLKNQIAELEMQKQIKQMQLEQLHSELQAEKHLNDIGASTTDKARRAELAYGEAKLELDQLDRKIENEKKRVQAEIHVKELELTIFERSLHNNVRILDNAKVLSPLDATLTYINNEIGAQITEGSRLAIVSDLAQFKVNAEIADGHAEKLTLGGRAIVAIGNVELPGSIVNITPSSTNGIINFTVVLDDAHHSSLRSGLQVEVNVVYGLREHVLRIPNAQFFGYGRGEYDLWVVGRGSAEKRKVKLGESSFEFIEVLSGLNENETVILSDMEKYRHKNSIKIN